MQLCMYILTYLEWIERRHSPCRLGRLSARLLFRLAVTLVLFATAGGATAATAAAGTATAAAAAAPTGAGTETEEKEEEKQRGTKAECSRSAEAEGGATSGWGRVQVTWREPLKHETRGDSKTVYEANSGGESGSARDIDRERSSCLAAVARPRPLEAGRCNLYTKQHMRLEATQHHRRWWS